MKILISGATGLVGRNLTNLCLKSGAEVHFLTTNKEKLNGINGASGFYWDPGKGEIDTNCFTGITHIINLAGAPIASRWTPANKKKIRSSRIDSLRTLYKGLESIDSHTVSSLVSASAIGIYPDSLTTFYTEEEASADSGFAAQVVKDWEHEARKFQKIINSVAIARIGLVLSEMGGALVKMAQPVKYGAGAAFGSGEQWQSWIHIEDLSNMLLHMAENEMEGVYVRLHFQAASALPGKSCNVPPTRAKVFKISLQQQKKRMNAIFGCSLVNV